MIVVYVKHYLNKIGRDYFDTDWFPHVLNLISQQNGFLDITTFREKDDQECINIIVKFINSESLCSWVNVTAHAPVGRRPAAPTAGSSS